MYSRHESVLLKQKFWTSFGQYMRPVKNAVGDDVNWVNYKTGIRKIFFKLDAGKSFASIAIEIRHSDRKVQQTYYEKFLPCRSIFDSVVNVDWDWNNEHVDDNGNIICRMSKTLVEVNVFKESDWPAIISFLKNNIILLDRFWQDVKDMIE